MQDSHPLARLRLETAWANQMTWNTAMIVNFCFETDPAGERHARLARWQELWDLAQAWARDRPGGFDPIWHGPADDDDCFPQIWFTADWHGILCFFTTVLFLLTCVQRWHLAYITSLASCCSASSQGHDSLSAALEAFQIQT